MRYALYLLKENSKIKKINRFYKSQILASVYYKTKNY